MKTKEKTHLERKKDIAKAKKRTGQSQKSTSYDITNKETSTPQKVRESSESPAQQQRFKK
jgi:hypothetical protein